MLASSVYPKIVNLFEEEFVHLYFHIRLYIVLFCVSALCWLFVPNVEPAHSRSSKGISEGETVLQAFSFMKDIDWKVFGDIFLVRFFLSFSSLVYRSNFSLLIDQNFGASPKVIGYLISFQVRLNWWVTCIWMSLFVMVYTFHWYLNVYIALVAMVLIVTLTVCRLINALYTFCIFACCNINVIFPILIVILYPFWIDFLVFMI